MKCWPAILRTFAKLQRFNKSLFLSPSMPESVTLSSSHCIFFQLHLSLSIPLCITSIYVTFGQDFFSVLCPFTASVYMTIICKLFCCKSPCVIVCIFSLGFAEYYLFNANFSRKYIWYHHIVGKSCAQEREKSIDSKRKAFERNMLWRFHTLGPIPTSHFPLLHSDFLLPALYSLPY